ncbi:hypothetical protein P3T73_04725 [Kiritimatiellota bacterium B12222]|nr:hypothetical protein P3T73_04725 [Kiritimatiellota bacterium B12222]
MKSIFPLSFLSVLLFTACTSVPDPDHQPTMSQKDCSERIEASLEFSSLPGQTLNFINYMASNPTTDMEVFFEALGKNISSTLLVIRDPYAQVISIRINTNMTTFTPAWNDRLVEGKSFVCMEDVVDTQMVGDFLRVQIDAPNIASGYFYIMCKEIEGRNLSEQVFVDYFRPGDAPAKISIEALSGLL